MVEECFGPGIATELASRRFQRGWVATQLPSRQSIVARFWPLDLGERAFWREIACARSS
jgi:hypothetical protein